MVQVAVLGLGNWGTALAQHLALRGHDVLGWSIETAVVDSINHQHINPRYLSDVNLSTSLRATTELAEVLQRPVQLFVVPSKFMGSVLPKLKLAPRTLFISAVKGIEPQTLTTPLQFASQFLTADARLAVLSGPSFAKDVVRQRPCGLVAASKDEAVAREVGELFTSDSMRVYLSTDPLGVELGGIVKNVIAVAVGISDGLGLGESARAGLITRGLAEMMRLAEAMGADTRTLSGLSGLGDLAMTSTSDTSRNRTVGLRLGRGEKLAEIVNSLGSVAEGVTTAPLVLELARRHNVEMPISDLVDRLLREQIDAKEAVRALISRPMRKEIG